MSEPEPAPARPPIKNCVGMPAAIYLEEFGSHVWAAFGEPPFLVGSAAQGNKQWRDVDVRLVLDDETCKRIFGTDDPDHTNGRWVALCLAFSALGKHMTGLPIDFQVQGMTAANKRFHREPRLSLGIVELRFCKEDRKTPDAPSFGGKP